MGLAAKTDYKIPRQDLVDLLLWSKKRGLLTETSQAIPEEEETRVMPETLKLANTESGGKDSAPLLPQTEEGEVLLRSSADTARARGSPVSGPSPG